MPQPALSNPPSAQLFRLRHVLDQLRRRSAVCRGFVCRIQAVEVRRLRPVVADPSEASVDDDPLHCRQ